MSWPNVKPTTICIYENESAATDPGTEIKVTPDIAAPIIASVARGHEVRRLPMKKRQARFAAWLLTVVKTPFLCFPFLIWNWRRFSLSEGGEAVVWFLAATV